MDGGANSLFYAVAAAAGGFLTFLITSTRNRYQKLDANFFTDAESCKSEVRKLTAEVLILSKQLSALQTSVNFLTEENEELKRSINAQTRHTQPVRVKRPKDS
jgi:predicted  nucleic acid-binding Zn-ribbon protein